MAMDQLLEGLCDLCGKEVDAKVEDVFSVTCSVDSCGESLYHENCLKKFIASGSKSTHGKLPKIPYTCFPCGQGKGRGSSRPDNPCKGLAAHSKRVMYKAPPKAPPPQPPQPTGPPPRVKGPNTNKAAADAAGSSGPHLVKRPAKLKPNTNVVARLPPIPTSPRPGPLGRNLGGAPRQEAIPGLDSGPAEQALTAEEAAARAAAGKAAKKNQKRAAKRREAGGTDAGSATWDAASLADSATDGASGAPGEEDGGESHAGSGFITSIDAYQAMLARQLGLCSDSDLEYEDDSEDSDAAAVAMSAAAAPPPGGWSTDRGDPGDDDGEGWQAVGRARGSAAAPAPPPAAVASARPAADGDKEEAALRRQEEEQLRLALAASMQETAGASGGGTAGDDYYEAAAASYEAQLAAALAASRAAEAAEQQRLAAEQAAILAELEARRQQPARAVSSGDGWGAVGPSAVWQQQQQQAVPLAAAPGYNHHGAGLYKPVMSQPQHAHPPSFAPATPDPAAPRGYHPAQHSTTTAAGWPGAGAVQQQQQQSQAPLPWLQPATAGAGGYQQQQQQASYTPASYTPAPAPPAAAEAAPPAGDDDDLDDLLALLTT